MQYLLLACVVAVHTAAGQPVPGTGSIAGHVLHSLTSAPVRRATVTLTADHIRLAAETDAAGKFEFSGLPAGTYKVAARRAGFLERAARRSISLGADGHVTDAEVRLPPQCVIQGRVLDQGGDPVDSATVFLERQIYRRGRRIWQRHASAGVNEIGDYRFSNLAPGSYVVHAVNTRPLPGNRFGSPPKTTNIPTYYPNASTRQLAALIQLGVGTEARGMDIQLLTVAVPPRVRVRGRITGVPPGGQAIVSLAFVQADGGVLSSAHEQAYPPDYTFDLRLAPAEYLTLGSVYSGSPAAYITGRLTISGDMEGVVLTMVPAPVITGRVRQAEGGVPANLKDFRLTLVDISNRLVDDEFELSSDAEGKLSPFPKSFSRPGHYGVMKMRSIPEGFYVREIKLGGEAISPDDFEILSSAELEIILGNHAGKITGSALDVEGKASPASTIALISADGKARPVSAIADDNGSFQFPNLRPGTYKLFAWYEAGDDQWPDPEFRKGYEKHAVEVTVGPGESQNVQLQAR